jgi:hypothetical protein
MMPFEGGRDWAHPRDGDRCDERVLWRVACIVGSINGVGCGDASGQLQFDVLRGERDQLDMVFDQRPLVVGKRLRVGAERRWRMGGIGRILLKC